MGDTYTRQSSYTDGDVITAAHTNNEFNQLLAAFAASTGHTHDGTAAEGGPVTKLLGNGLTFGAGTAGTDITITFDGETNDGELKWMEDEDYFEFSDDILVASTEKLQFRDTAIYINSSTDGQLDLVADTEIQIAATTIDINGNVDISGTLTIGSAGISEAELEILDGATVTTTELNIIDGDTSATSTTVADADRVVFNDGGTMKQVAVTDLAAYFDDEITAMPNLTSVGTLTTLTVDNVIINGTTIGHTDDTDLITLADGIATVAGEVSMTTLDIGGTNVTSTAAELNILDGVTATAAELNYSDTGAAVGTVVASKVVTVDSNKDVASFRNITLTGELDAGSLDVSGNADIDGTLEADAITVNGTALNTVIAGVTVTDATNSAHVLVTDNESTNEENLITFVEGATSSTGNVGLEMDGNLTYNPSTGTVTSTIFKGNIDAVDGDFDGTLEADAITLDGTAITTVATLSTGISNGNLPVFTSGAADNDFLRIDGTSIEGRSASEVLSDIAAAPAAGSSNIVTTGALNSGSITSGFGAINNGSSAITTTGTMTFGSLSDGSITVTAFVDEDDMSSDSATLIPTQQSVKAFVEANAGSFNSFFIEDDDGTEVTIDNAKELKFIGSGITTNFTDTSTGSDGDPFDLTFTVDAAQTGINSIKNTSLVIGRDDDNLIKFSTDNQIIFEVSGGDNVIFKASGEIEASSLDISGDIDVDGTTNLDVVDIDGNVDIATSATLTCGPIVSSISDHTNLSLTSTNADANAGPKIALIRDSGSPADDDLVGGILFKADDDGGNSTEFASIQAKIRDAGDGSGGSEDGQIEISTIMAGTSRSRIRMNDVETVFNQDAQSLDFRVESGLQSSAFFLEGSTGNISIGHNAPTADATLAGTSVPSGTKYFHIHETDGAVLKLSDPDKGSNRGVQLAIIDTTAILNNCEGGNFIIGNGNTGRMTIDSGGQVSIGSNLFIGTTAFATGTAGTQIQNDGFMRLVRDGNGALDVGRLTNDGELIKFRAQETEEGSVSVSGTTVSFNGGHLSRWSRMLDGSKPANLLRGTVMSNLDDMIVWSHDAVAATVYKDGDDIPEDKKVGDVKTPAVDAYNEDNEQLNHTKISDTEGDVNVAGVFVAWDDGDTYKDYYLGMTGDMVIRIGKDATVARGDLLMSAGDGTAKPQGDDIVRSKTIAKVISVTKSHTYDDGSYLVPCVLMAC